MVRDATTLHAGQAVVEFGAGTAGHFVEYDADTGRCALSPEQAAVLAP
jgi:hypothetical protein